MTTAPIPIGLIGTGIHGSRYAHHLLKDLPGLRLEAISRRGTVGAYQAREWNTRWIQDWEDLVTDPQVAAVIAVAPPTLHLDIARACARAGKPLLLEKPLAPTVQAGQEIISVMKEAGVPLTIAQTLRYNRVIQALRRELDRVGELLAFSANQRLEDAARPWMLDPRVAGGGVVLHTAVHVFDALWFITGRQLRRVRAWTYAHHATQVEDLVVALLELEGGVAGTLDVGRLGPARTGRYEWIGTRGQLHGDQIHHLLEWIHQTQRTPLPLDPPVHTLIPLLQAWEAHLRGRGPNPIPGEEGLRAVAACEACYRSAQEGREVSLEALFPETGSS